MVPDNILLEPPFEGACLYSKKAKLATRRSYKKKRFIIPVSLLAAIAVVAVVLGSVFGSRSTNKAASMYFDFLFNSKVTDG
ncbi:unnamed protein product [Rotaria sordida]|uniref:Transmembrane protein n=1 Tax=Rotaria sordida TaxID=392033 RepID=A0A814TJK5_9BILA|nr:unnamed protein product [Rotaria sordida]